MTVFIVVCAAMLLVTLAWTTLPLWRPLQATDATSTRTERRTSGIVVILAVTGIAAMMYAYLSNWDWNTTQTATAETASVNQMLTQLEAKLAANPDDVKGWLLLGRSYTALQRFPLAVAAYQQAYDRTNGENVEAIIGLGEAMALADQSSLNARAGELFNAALLKAPNHPKALWYGSIAALQAGDLQLGRDRLQSLLAQNPPEQMRVILERQVQDINQQLGEAGEGGSATPATQAAAQPAQRRVIHVAVTIAPAIQKQIKGPTPLFVVARDPAATGPPLAVQRRSSAEVPLTVTLSEGDAMLPSRTIATVPRVQVVARLSLSGAPQQRSGDFYGEADYDFSKDTGTLQITIDRTVP